MSLNASSCQIATQILQCKAILGGLDWHYQFFCCPAQEQQNVHPEVVLALKASVQVATHSLFVAFTNLIGLGSGPMLGPDEPSTAAILRQSSPSGFSSDEVGTATNMTLSIQNSARIISLPGHHPCGPDDFSPHRTQNGKRASSRSWDGSRVSSAPLPMPVDWQSPFSLPDPLAFDNSRACTMLTDRYTRPATTIPKIMVETCEVADTDSLPLSIHIADKSPPHKANPLVSQHCPTDSFERRYSVTPGSPHDVTHANDSPTSTMYIPYRPWYKPLDRTDSRISPISAQGLSNARYKAGLTVIGAVAPPFRPIAELETDLSHPPMPTRSPPPPPSLPLLVRSKRKPPVLPRRRASLVEGSKDSTNQDHLVKRALHSSSRLVTHVSAPSGGPATPNIVVLPYLDELKQVLESEPSPQRRASTGDLRLGAHCNEKTVVRTGRELSLQNTGALATSPLHRNGMRRSRSASAPEFTTLKVRLPLSYHLPELATEPQANTRHSDQMTTNDKNEAKQLPEVVEASLISERINNICDSWNSRNWPKAESYLTHYLSIFNDADNTETARRIRHLLGVCASYRGQWHRALTWFISVVDTPVLDLRKLDRGDRAAFYWLGDAYSLLNRKEEALLAYCLAGVCDETALASKLPRSHRCLRADQEQLRQTVSKSSYKAIWAYSSFRSDRAREGGILHCNIVSQPIAQMCLQSLSLSEHRCGLHMADLGSITHDQDASSDYDPLLINPAHFVSSYLWPMPYDPTFDLQSVAQGGLMAQHTDILRELQESPERLHFNKRFSPNLSGPSCDDLRRLIAALRESLQTLAMSWGEVVSSTGIFFLAQYHSVENNIATINHFRIEIVRLSFRNNGYGLDFCSDGTGSARVTSTVLKSDGSLDAATKKELRRCLHVAISSTCTRQRKTCSINPSSPTQSLPLPSLRRSPSPPPQLANISFETSTSAAELESPDSTPQTSVDLSTLVPPPIATASKPAPTDRELPSRARARVSIQSSYNELHLLGSLVR